VLVEGEIWNAISTEPVAVGAPLLVVGSEQYLLQVEPDKAQKTAANVSLE
jgi:membrane-bound ClpP family serine protease